MVAILFQSRTKQRQKLLNLTRCALGQLRMLMGDFCNRSEGYTSHAIGTVAQRTLDRIITSVSVLAEGSVPGTGEGRQLAELCALLEGARSVPDASHDGMAVLDSARRIADALAEALLDTPSPRAELIEALEASLTPVASMPSPRALHAATPFYAVGRA